jgi:voltage-gated potassium channel
VRAFGPRKRRIFGQISLRSRVAEALTRPGVDLLVMALILASLAVVIAERALAPSGGEIAWLGTIDLALTGVFAVELSIRFYAAKKKRRFFRRYWLDMLSLLPAVGALPSLRLLRMLRLFRLGLLFSRRFTFVQGLIRLNIYEVWVLVLTTLILVVGGGGLVFLFEGNSSPDFSTLSGSLWWALESIIAGEPIGPIPTSSAGRTVLVLVMLAGMTLFAVFTGVISAAMIDRLSGRKETWDMDLDELEGHVVVCGYNAGVPALLRELAIEPDLSRARSCWSTRLDEPPDPRKLGLRPELVYHVRRPHEARAPPPGWHQRASRGGGRRYHH